MMRRPFSRPWLLACPSASACSDAEGSIRFGAWVAVDMGGFLGFIFVIPGRAEREPGISRFRVWSFGPSRNDKLSIHPQKIPLADFHAIVAQDAVGGRGVEVEIRKRKIIEELLALQRHGVGPAHRKGNLAGIPTLELFRLERLYIINRPGEPLLEFIEGLFGIGSGRYLALREPRTALSGEIANKLDLFTERQHVRIQPRAEQHFGRNILRLAVRLGLGEDAGEAAEELQECRNGSVVEGHVLLFLLWLSFRGIAQR